jgi:superfamily II DNA/RNA helicase
MSKESFSDLGVSEPIVAALERRSIQTPFSIQSLVIPDALAGNDVLAKSPTGSGKTIAFAAPIVQRLDAADARPSALVLVPTRELATQVAEEFEAIGRSTGLKVTLYGGTSVSAQEAAKGAHILVATPGLRILRTAAS